MTIDYKFIIIIALIAWIALKDSCNPATDTTVKIERDTVIVNYTPPPVVVNAPPGKPQIIIREVPATIDTGQILRAYFAQVNYQDTIRTDSAEVVVSEVVSMNAIQSRQIGFRYLFPPCSTVTITEKITLPPTRKVLIGVQAGYMDKPFIMPSVAYQPRTGHLFMAGYNGGFSIGYLHKINIRRRKQE